MGDPTTTNIDNGVVILNDAVYIDGLLALDDEDTIALGTILARREVSSTIANGVAGVGNTGDGTCTACALYGNIILPKIGAYQLECTAEVGNGGVWKLSDPNGVEILSGITMTPGAGGATIFNSAGVGFTFTLTDGAEDFDTGDTFDITITADGDLVLFAVDGVGGAQFARYVLDYEVAVAAQADVPVRVIQSGTVRQEKLIVDAGDTVTTAILEMLRDYKIDSKPVQELNIEDNQ
jgi:hypothetical protein